VQLPDCLVLEPSAVYCELCKLLPGQREQVQSWLHPLLCERRPLARSQRGLLVPQVRQHQRNARGWCRIACSALIGLDLIKYELAEYYAIYLITYATDGPTCVSICEVI